MTLEQVEQLIESSRPRSRLLRGSTIAMLGLSMLLGAMAADPSLIPFKGPAGWLLPQFVLLGLVLIVAYGTRKQRRLAHFMQDAFEAVQLREWPRAREAIERLLTHPVAAQTGRAQSLLALATVAESDKSYDASQKIYESLLEENQADPLQLHTARVALAAAMLRTGQITDAVSLIDRLQKSDLPKPLQAQVAMLSLFREIAMGQTSEATKDADKRRELFRDHLGTRAGYGYSLLAAAFDRANQPELARRYWHDATLLVEPTELLQQFDELAAVAGKYPAAEIIL